MRGIILRESLQSNILPAELEDKVVNRYGHLLSGKQPVEVIVVVVDQIDLPVAAFAVAGELAPRGFFAHFVCADHMVVVFPHCISVIDRGNQAAVERTKAIGRMFDIPDKQMKFDEMFETDHPNDW